MRRGALPTRPGWPPELRSAAAWLELPEITSGRYLLAEMGWVSSAREKAVAAGVPDLPAPRGTLDNDLVALPAVMVIGEQGRMQMFRLPVCYAASVRRFFLLDERLWRDHQPPADSIAELPCHFVVGDRQDVYMAPDGQAKNADHLN